MVGKSERPSRPATAMAAPDNAPRIAESTMHSTYWRPRMRPISRSSELNRTSMAPERNRISPMTMNSGTADSAPSVAVE